MSYASPFAPPSYYYSYGADQDGGKKEEAPTSFSLGARSVAYLIILLFSVACIAFSTVVLCAQTYMTFTLYTNYSIVPNGITEPFPYFNMTVLSLTATSSYRASTCENSELAANGTGTPLTNLFQSYTYLHYLGNNLVREAESGHAVLGDYYPRPYCVKATDGARNAGASAIVCLVMGVCVLVLVMALLLLACLHWHTADPSKGDAKVRQGLSIAALILSLVCMVMSIVGLATGVSMGNKVKQEVDAVFAEMKETWKAWDGTKDFAYKQVYTKPVESNVVWPFIPMLICSAISTLLLFMPGLSGIADSC